MELTASGTTADFAAGCPPRGGCGQLTIRSVRRERWAAVCKLRRPMQPVPTGTKPLRGPRLAFDILLPQSGSRPSDSEHLASPPAHHSAPPRLATHATASCRPSTATKGDLMVQARQPCMAAAQQAAERQRRRRPPLPHARRPIPPGFISPCALAQDGPLEEDDPLLQFIEQLPKAELHIHVEGTLEPGGCSS